MLRTLPLVTVRQQQGQLAEAPPLQVSAGDELVDHDLGAVGEIAELRFPDNQCLRAGCRVAILEGQHRQFGQHGIDERKPRPPFRDLLERDETIIGLLVMQHGMAR